MTALKQKISKYITDNGLNPTSFGRKADISPGIITHIMSSDSTNPTIETALKIAKLMNCSLDELFDREFLSGNSKINKELLQSICSFLCNLDEMEGKTLDDFCNITKYIYSYCEENSLTEVDKNFVKWYVSKIYNN
jgi:DNA-binding XRE family transcriptional regulator